MNLIEAVHLVNYSEDSRSQVISFIFNDTDFKIAVHSYVKKNGGTPEEAALVFDDTIVQFIKTAFSPNSTNLKGELEPYLMGIARHLWFAELRKKNRINSTEFKDQDITDNSPSIETLYLTEERYKLLDALLIKLKGNCKLVLMHWANGFSMTEIAQKLGYQSEGMARKKKSHCLSELNDFLFQNPSIKMQLQP